MNTRQTDDITPAGAIAYRFETPAYPGNILYVNLVANYGCNNDCLFCSRPRDGEHVENIYERKAGSNLFLPRSPSVEETLAAIAKEILPDDQEVALIGLGEPLLFFATAERVIMEVKRQYGVRTRVDTNGLVKCVHEDAAARLARAGLDEISISVNAVNAQEYEALCRPKPRNAFRKLTEFVRESSANGIETFVSFVTELEKGGLEGRSSEEYTAFARSLGIDDEHVILRPYIPLIQR